MITKTISTHNTKEAINEEVKAFAAAFRRNYNNELVWEGGPAIVPAGFIAKINTEEIGNCWDNCNIDSPEEGEWMSFTFNGFCPNIHEGNSLEDELVSPFKEGEEIKSPQLGDVEYSHIEHELSYDDFLNGKELYEAVDALVPRWLDGKGGLHIMHTENGVHYGFSLEDWEVVDALVSHYQFFYYEPTLTGWFMIAEPASTADFASFSQIWEELNYVNDALRRGQRVFINLDNRCVVEVSRPSLMCASFVALYTDGTAAEEFCCKREDDKIETIYAYGQGLVVYNHKLNGSGAKLFNSKGVVTPGKIDLTTRVFTPLA